MSRTETKAFKLLPLFQLHIRFMDKKCCGHPTYKKHQHQKHFSVCVLYDYLVQPYNVQ